MEKKKNDYSPVKNSSAFQKLKAKNIFPVI